jgi:hypothetical protein
LDSASKVIGKKGAQQMPANGLFWKLSAGFMLSLVLLAGLGAASALADTPPNRAGLVVMHGIGQVQKICVSFSEPAITGLDLLHKAGLELNVDASNPVGVAVCSIQREGCTFPAQQCFCQCQGATCTYWSYWHLTGGMWQYSGMGTANLPIHNGDVDGWVWGPGTITSANPPPQVTIDDLCPPARIWFPVLLHAAQS